jgi:cytochrome P450
MSIYLHLSEADDNILSPNLKTSTALTSLFSMLLMKPGIQKKLQQELDDVVGEGRTPKMVDLPSLNYLRACWVENLRLNPPAAIGTRLPLMCYRRKLSVSDIGVPRSTAQEDEWKGYIIPKGTMIVTNIG